MRPIRAWHKSIVYYLKVFREVSGLSREELDAFDLWERRSTYDGTNRLTKMRETLAAAGYEKEVAATDARFLAEHRGMRSEKAWEDFWAFYSQNDEVICPKDAL